MFTPTDILVRKDKLEKENFSPDLNLFQIFIFYLKIIYSSWTSRLLIILSPMFVGIALGIMFPIYISVGASQIFITTLSAGLIWGIIYFSIRRTTFYDNLQQTKISIFKIYIAIWLSMLFVTFCSELIFWFTEFILINIIGISTLFDGAIKLTGKDFWINWSSIGWLTIIYTWIASVTLVFMICFTVRNFFKREQSFFICFCIYILFLVPFGGTLPPTKENFYYIPNQGIQLDIDRNVDSVIKFIFPIYHLNLMNYSAVWSGTVTGVVEDVVNGYQTLGNMEFFSAFKWSTSTAWNLNIMYPLFVGLILTIFNWTWIFIHYK